jgi:hypothetical protein
MDYSKLIEMLKEWADAKFVNEHKDNPYCQCQADGVNMAKFMVKTKIELFESLNS